MAQTEENTINLPYGEILTDIKKKKWKIGSIIGQGAFGTIYNASSFVNNENNCYAIKLEQKSSGPLFVERNFMIRFCKIDDINKYKEDHELSFLGIPHFIATGSHNANNMEYRFLVLPCFGNSIHDLMIKKLQLPLNDVLQFGSRILDSLEYIHNKGYTHNDIKASNILLGLEKNISNPIYVIDFGLIEKISVKSDKNKANNGTQKFCSRDAHKGKFTKRGDLEMLGYNMLYWISSKLPWQNLKQIQDIEQCKIAYMNDLQSLFELCFESKYYPISLYEYFNYINTIECYETPDYNKCHDII